MDSPTYSNVNQASSTDNGTFNASNTHNNENNEKDNSKTKNTSTTPLNNGNSLDKQIERERRMKMSLDDPVVQDRIGKLMRMENLADITLAGFTIKLIRLLGTIAFKELADEVAKCYDALRRSDGSRYTGDHIKALKGCLSSSDVFKEGENSTWSIDETKAQVYEKKTTEKIKEVLKKQYSKQLKKIEAEGPVDEEELFNSNKARKPSEDENLGKRSMSISFEACFDTLSSISKAFKSEGKAQFFVPNQIEQLQGGEAPLQLLRAWGKERLTGVLQCFDFFTPVLQDYIRLKAAEASRMQEAGVLQNVNLNTNNVSLPTNSNMDGALEPSATAAISLEAQESLPNIDISVPVLGNTDENNNFAME